MSGWKKYKLGEIAEVQNGYAFKSDDLQQHGIPVIKIKNIQPPNISMAEADHYPHPITPRLSQFIIKRKDILISMTGSHVSQIASAVGKVGRYSSDELALLNQRVGKVYSKDLQRLNNDFLYYFIAQPEIQFELATNAGGSANQANISPSDIRKLEIVLPEISIQTRIAEILSALDDKIEVARRSNQTLEAIAQTLFRKYFVDDIDAEQLPEGWRLVRLGEISLRITKGTTPTTLKKHFTTSGINFLKVETLTENGGFELNKLNFIDEETDEILSRSRIQEDDILFSIAGTLGRIAKATTQILPANTNQALAIIRPDKSVTHPLFIYYSLKLPEVKEEIFTKAVQGVQANLSLTVLSNTQVVIPTKEYLEKAIGGVADTHKMIERNQQQIRNLSTLRDTLLPKLLSSELPIPATPS